jgi:hypothetical protein
MRQRLGDFGCDERCAWQKKRPDVCVGQSRQVELATAQGSEESAPEVKVRGEHSLRPINTITITFQE